MTDFRVPRAALGRFHLGTRLPLVILLTGVGLRLWWFQGIGLNDDTEYADSAYRLATGIGIHQYPLNSIDSIRFAMVLPLAAVYRAFGVGNVTSGIFPLACSTLTMWLTYVLGRDLLSPAAGMLGLALLATFPLDIVYSTQLVPTVPVATCWVIALWLFVSAEQARGRGGRAPAVLAVLSGVVLGISWLVNESGPLFAVALLTWTIVTKSSWRSLALAAGGALAVFVMECAAFRMLCGSFLWRLNVIRLEEERVLTNTSAGYYPRVLFNIRHPDFFAQEGHFGLFAYGFLASLPVLLWRSRRGLALWISVTLMMLWFQYGIMTPEGRPIAKWIRYLIVLLPFAILAFSHALLLIGQRTGRLLLSFAIAVMIGTGVWSAAAAQAANAEQTADFKEIAAAIRALTPGKPVYVGQGELGFVDVYLGRARTLHVLDEAVPSDLDDCFVFLYGSRSALEDPATRLKTDELFEIARTHWVEVARIRAANAGIFARFDPVLYYVPPQRSARTRVLAQIKDPAGDLRWDVPPRATAFLPDVIEANVLFDPELLTLNFEWMFRDPIPDVADPSRVGLVCFWRLTLDGSDPWVGQPDFYVRVGWYREGIGLFVDDGRPDNEFTFDRTCNINRRFIVRGSRVRATVPITCFTRAGQRIPADSLSLKATFEAAITAGGRWIVRDVAATVASIPRGSLTANTPSR